MLKINITADLRPLKKALTEFQQKQVPWATALAVTRLAQGVVQQEVAEMKETFDSPTPFTLKSITMKSATKSNPTAIVYPKEIAAAYLTPYVVGGDRSLGGKKGMLVPKNIPLNQYGNIPRNKIAQLKATPGVFVGGVKTKKGETINGVWKRIGPPKGVRGKRGQPPRPAGHLKLLIRFSDTTPVPRRLPFYEAAQAYLRANYRKAFNDALAEAMRTARRK